MCIVWRIPVSEMSWQRIRHPSDVVKPGDTPSGIAEKTGVPLSKILALNPNLDDQSLSVGDKIKLR